MLGHDGNGLEQSPRLGREVRDAPENRVAHGRRHGFSTRSQDLRDEERVPTRAAMELVAVDPVRLGQGADAFARERPQAQAIDADGTAKAAEDDPQGVGRLELVVAIGREHERGRRLDAAAKQAQHVESRLVRPVQVFEHEHARPLSQLVEQRGHDLVRQGATGDKRFERVSGLGGHVSERPERPRRE